ncbi:MAG: class I SAM-dependent methyltransferase [Verrucomicrobiota bacterium]|nr:class I SAM-dependent methyltransferase [Verrucomicrobiota bacterium]
MRSENLIRDLPSLQFSPRLYGVGAWTGHLHFGYDLVALLRPRVVVELGVDRGESYFTFCQAAAEHDTRTRCLGVDTWKGDEQAGGYDETTFSEVSSHNREHYAASSTLVRATFDEALGRFADGELDLLHIDGLHTEAAVRNDVKHWLPKLRGGGILLLHDVSVRTRDFGVWKVWDELRESGRSYTFAEGPGLGVWQKPPAEMLAPPLEALLTAPNESREELIAYYRQRALELEDMIAQHWRDGSIRDTPFAAQTVIQVFFTRDGTHREEDSVFARVGHDEWKEVRISIPPGACDGSIRIDFVSALTTIDLAEVELLGADGSVSINATSRDALAGLRVSGDAVPIPHAKWFRLQITGIDPQVFLPPITVPENAEPVVLKLRLRVNVGKPGSRRRVV